MLTIKPSVKKRVAIDGRVFSTEAHDRGMGRYVRHLNDVFVKAGYETTFILYKGLKLKENDPVRTGAIHVHLDPSRCNMDDVHPTTDQLESLLSDGQFDFFLDATPFITPMRFDILACPTIAVAYDLIPLRYPSSYLTLDILEETYQKALDSLRKADAIIAISEYTKGLVCDYLGIEQNKVFVICPNLDESYADIPSLPREKRSGIFSIVGGHKSKNTVRALGMLDDAAGKINEEVNATAPTAGQHAELSRVVNTLGYKRVRLSYAIPEAQKIAMQQSASIVCHFSIEEGFGIPLLEALFAGSPVLCTDIGINHEILAMGGDYSKVAVLIPPASTELGDQTKQDIAAVTAAIDTQSGYFTRLKAAFADHWYVESPKRAIAACACAQATFDTFHKNVRAAMLSNMPGQFCGVADYAGSIPLGLDGNMILFTKDVKANKMTAMPNVRIASWLSVPDKVPQLDVPVIYHLALSDRLDFGVSALNAYGREKDIVFVHDHYYLLGVLMFFYNEKKLSPEFDSFFVGSDRRLLREIRAMSREELMNHLTFKPIESAFESNWLREKGCTLVSHLTAEAAAVSIEKGRNQSFDSAQTYVPIGIDDRALPITAQLADMWRLKLGFSNNDLLIGAMGSITSNKYLYELAQGVMQYCTLSPYAHVRPAYLVLSGSIIEPLLYQQIENLFADNGIKDRLIYVQQNSEMWFDAMMKSLDLVCCARVQDRGQLSHSLVRALSLGCAIITNADSGYAMIEPAYQLPPEHFAYSVLALVQNVANGSIDLSTAHAHNRKAYEQNHRIENMVGQAIEKAHNHTTLPHNAGKSHASM